MSNRPAQIRYLTEGLSLGAAVHKGFAATWNWVLSFVNSFKGGKGCKVVNADGGFPRLDVLIEAGDGCTVTGGENGKPYVISLDKRTNPDNPNPNDPDPDDPDPNDPDPDDPDPDPDDPTGDQDDGPITGEREVCFSAVYDTSTHMLKRKFVTVKISKGLITNWPEEPSTDDDNPIFTAEPHAPEVS